MIRFLPKVAKASVLPVIALVFSSCVEKPAISAQGRWVGEWKITGKSSVVKQRLYISDNDGKLSAKLQGFDTNTDKWSTAPFDLTGKRDGNKIDLSVDNQNGAAMKINGTITGKDFSGNASYSWLDNGVEGTVSLKKESDSPNLLPDS